MDSTKLVPMQGSACCASCAPAANQDDIDTGHSCACCAHDHDHDQGPADQRRELIKMGISALLFVIGMVADERLAAYMPTWLVIAVFYALPYILCGYEVLSVGLKSIL